MRTERFNIEVWRTAKNESKAEQGADGKTPEAAQPPHELTPNTRLP